jgi:chromosome partitioning protein
VLRSVIRELISDACVRPRQNIISLAPVVLKFDLNFVYRAATLCDPIQRQEQMRHIMVLNPKGGCGKSTIATNLASFYAGQGKNVALVDYDPQRSSLDWLDRRPTRVAEIRGIAGYKYGLRQLNGHEDIVVMDAPARSLGKELTSLVAHADTILVPVLPSTIDMQATAKFLSQLGKMARVAKKRAKIAVLANRIRENTLIFDELDAYLGGLKVPYVATLREAQNYIRAYTRGLGIFELPQYLAWPDLEEWGPLTDYLESRGSRP